MLSVLIVSYFDFFFNIRIRIRTSEFAFDKCEFSWTPSHPYFKVSAKRMLTGECYACAAWSGWSDWGPCSSRCEPGVQRRTRTCLTVGCDGDDSEQRTCQPSDHCPGTNTCVRAAFARAITKWVQGKPTLLLFQTAVKTYMLSKLILLCYHLTIICSYDVWILWWNNTRLLIV